MLRPSIQTSSRKDPPTRYRAAKVKATTADSPVDVTKKRPADHMDAEGSPPGKRARQTEETSGPFNYDEIPKPRLDAAQPRARAMKGRGGKRAVKPRPVSNKKNTKQSGENQTIAITRDGEGDDADKTLVEQIEPKQPEVDPLLL